MTTREELLQYAQSVHLAIHGTDIPRSVNTSDHPYGGFDLDLIKDLVNGDLVKSQVRKFEADLKEEVKSLFDLLQKDCPIKVTKGSKDKRGLEGFILHSQDPIHGSTGKALFVYDILTNKSCMVRSSAVKVRIPKHGERDILRETYAACSALHPHFTTGKRVELKADTSRKGYLVSDAKLDPNLNGDGFYQVQVQWNDHQSPQNGTYILTELDIIN